MKYYLIALSFIFLIACGSDDSGMSGDIPVPEGFTLVWNDEFDQRGIDPTKWVFETGNGTDFGLPPGWGNNEKQIYTLAPSNASIQMNESDNSVLAITALESGNGYTSAKITTQGLLSVRYGKVEARAKLPTGQGMWPAFWMLGDNITEIEWPGCGEIDIFEVLGHAPDTAYQNVHYTSEDNKHLDESGNSRATSGTFADDYHIFTLDWTPESLIYSIDGQQVHQVTIQDDMKEFQRGMYLILNVAVGGNWPGDPDETTVFPQSMYVDYVRVYSQNGQEVSDPPVLDIEEETVGQVIEAGIAESAVSTGYTAFGGINIAAWGAGGEPTIEEANEGIDGDKSIRLLYPGGNWGGAFFELDEGTDFSSFADASLYFSLKMDAGLVDAEVKLESSNQTSSHSLFLADYTPEELGDGWVGYTIPMADFADLDLTDLKIPFALWNPMDANEEFFIGNVLVDDIRIE